MKVSRFKQKPTEWYGVMCNGMNWWEIMQLWQDVRDIAVEYDRRGCITVCFFERNGHIDYMTDVIEIGDWFLWRMPEPDVYTDFRIIKGSAEGCEGQEETIESIERLSGEARRYWHVEPNAF